MFLRSFFKCCCQTTASLSFCRGWETNRIQPRALILNSSYARFQLLSLRGRRLKGKGKGALGKGFLGARETRGARVVSHPNSLPLPFRTPATQATVAQRLVSAKPGLNFNLFLISFFFFKSIFSNNFLYCFWSVQLSNCR